MNKQIIGMRVFGVVKHKDHTLIKVSCNTSIRQKVQIGVKLDPTTGMFSCRVWRINTEFGSPAFTVKCFRTFVQKYNIDMRKVKLGDMYSLSIGEVLYMIAGTIIRNGIQFKSHEDLVAIMTKAGFSLYSNHINFPTPAVYEMAQIVVTAWKGGNYISQLANLCATYSNVNAFVINT